MGNPVVHFEIGCHNLDGTISFYKEMFGWETQPMPGMAMVDTGSKDGIHGHIASMPEHPPYVNFYVQVEKLEDAIAKAQKLGGKVMIPPQDVPGAGRFAWINDPDGAHVGLWQPAAQG